MSSDGQVLSVYNTGYIQSADMVEWTR